MIPKLEAIKYAMQNGLNEAVLLDGRMKNSLILNCLLVRVLER
jgi:acetylglutamate kinase